MEKPPELPPVPPEKEPLFSQPLPEVTEPSFTTGLTALKEKLEGTKSFLAPRSLLSRLRKWEPEKIVRKISEAFQSRGNHFYGTFLTIVLSTYFLSDLTALVVGEYLPEPPAPFLKGYSSGSGSSRSFQDYGPIFSRNLFNSKGLIPGEEEAAIFDSGGPAVKSSLALNLVGTLVMNNEAHSLATIEDKQTAKIYPVQVDDEIPGKIRILQIQPRKVTFMNLSASRKEYIDIPDESAEASRALIMRSTSSASSPGIEKVSATQFNISRSEVDKALSDMNTILTQARAVPNFENGVAAGYKLFQIVPGSIYDKLGLQNGDVISSLNGQPITDPAKAFEMLTELKTSNHLDLQVKKDGKPVNYSYDIGAGR